MDGLRFYPFCPLTSLQAATCQTARPRSLSWEYKQRADDRASIISPALLPSGTFVPSHLFLLLSFSRFASPLFPPISPLRFRFTPPSAFRPLAVFLATFGHDPFLFESLSSSLRHRGNVERRPPRDLNSSLPAPFPEFSSVKSAPLLHPSPPHRPPRDDS